MRDKIFYTSIFGFLIGVLLRSYFDVSFTFAILLAGVALGAIFFLRKKKIALLLSVLVLTFSLGVVRFDTVDVPNPPRYESHVDKKVKFSGIIANDPEIRPNNQRFFVRVDTEEHKFNILVSTFPGKKFEYGDKVVVSGKLAKAENFITDTGKEFDYINFLRKDKVLYTMSFAEAELLSSNHGNLVKKHLFRAKHFFVDKVNYAIRPPESDLMAGYILGEKSNFSDELTDAFISTGTIHIVALSGYNVTIIAEWIMKAFAFLGPASFYFGILAIIFFVVMTGGLSTAVRAGIMAILALVARRTGRTYEVGRGLLLAGFLMVLINPMTLRYDVSFQLSFIATVAVIYLAPRVEKRFKWITERFGLRDVISVTFAAYIFVLPFILFKMGNLSLVALPANFLVLPFIPITMMFGFATGFVGMVSGIISLVPGFVAYWLLRYELFVIEQFGSLPFASVTIYNFPAWLTIIVYGLFIYKLFGKDIKNFFKFEEDATW